MKNISDLCVKCQGKGLCGKPCPILNKFKILGKTKTHFSGSSPPEVFVGRMGYPNINAGILSPENYGDTEIYSLPELWHKNKFSIEDIISLRAKLIYAKFKTNIKNVRKKDKFLDIAKEISLTNKHVDTEVFLSKPVTSEFRLDNQSPIIGNPAPLKSIRLEENPKVEKKAEYLSNDTDVKAENAVIELYNSNLTITHITKLLSIGNLGLKTKRKLVPTRWSITATDDIISNFLLDKIRYYKEIDEILVFTSEYLGNHYEFLLLPDKFSFEVIEAKMTGSVWNPSSPLCIAKDYEGFNGRKSYASDVTGAYYANRLSLCEYLERIKRQSSCLVIREVREEYSAPCGVGILREASRNAFSKNPEKFISLQEAFKKIQTRLRLPISNFKNNSWLLKEYGKQTRLSKFLSN
jgi:hypothetical protein